MIIPTAIHEQVTITHAALLICTAYAIWWLYTLVSDPLRDIPGPPLARFTKLWLLRQYMNNDFPQTSVKLHAKYGPIVRIAPGNYSIDDLDAAKVIYTHGSEFVKDSWYSAWGLPERSFVHLFNDTDPKTHSVLRRKQASVYAMSSMVAYEPYVDDCTTILLQRLSEFAASGQVINMAHWFQCYAFEMIGKISFSRSLGFLEKGEDQYGIMAALDTSFTYSSCMGLWSSLHFTLGPLLLKLAPRASGMDVVNNLIVSLLGARRNEKTNPDGPLDFLGKFIAVQQKTPEKIADSDILMALSQNVGAGSDTTAIGLSSVLYFLCRNPAAMAKLRAELQDGAERGTVSDPITFQQAQNLPYLQAVIKESMRVHPPVGFTLPRVVPSGGHLLAGRFFPAGTTVGINPWVASRNTAVYGEDAHVFRPERWLEDPENASRREAYFFAFGRGSRTCVGKNISLLEMSKAIPQVVKQMDFELDFEGDWQFATRWFAKPGNFMCRVKRRTV